MGTKAYLLGQGYQNLRKHSSKTVSTMFVIIATMIVLGLFIVAFVNIDFNVNIVAEQQGLQAFIKDEILEEEVQSISTKIKSVANVKEIKYLNKDAALEDAKATLGSYSYLLKGIENSNPFPRSFLIIFNNLQDSENVKRTVETIDGIYNVKYNADIINAVKTISTIAKFVIFGIGFVMTIISIFIISNTIKLAVYSNKREIYIMKYIGATSSFIKAPFVLEGFLMGIGSAILSWIIVSLGYVVAYSRLPKVGSTLGVFGFVAYSEFWYYMLVAFLLIGVFLGAAGSSLATKKYLKDFKPEKLLKSKKKDKKQKQAGLNEVKLELNKNKTEKQKDKSKRRARKSLKYIFIIAVIISAIGVNNIYAVSKIDDIKDDIKDLEKKNKTILEQYSAIISDIGIYNKDLEALDVNITKYTSDLKKLRERVDQAEEEVNSINIKLQEASVDYQSTQDLLNTRLRVLYENGFVNIWKMLFTSHSITDFIAKYNVVVDLVKYDQQLLSSMANQKEYIGNIQRDASFRQAQVTQVQYDLEKSKQALEGAKASKEEKVNQLEKAKAELAKLKKSVQSQIAAMNKKLEEEIARSKNYNASFSGAFAWPVPGTYLVTAMFNDLWYYKYFGSWHRGVDIAKSSGPNIVAAQDGQIVTCKYNSSYGNLIIISHGKDEKTGNDIKTVYAHLASFAVSKDQIVRKGQVIGRMGTTGNSTGVHLHFEIRVNDKPVDPIFQFKGMSLTYASSRGYIQYPWSNLSAYQK